MNEQQIANICKVLGNDSRIRIITLLKEKPLCVQAISKRLGLTAAAVSQHLKILKSVQLVEPQKKGYYVHYKLNDDIIRSHKQFLDDLFDL